MNELRTEKYETKQAAAQAAADAGGTTYISGKRIVATATEDGDLRVYFLGGGEGDFRWRWMPPVEPAGIL